MTISVLLVDDDIHLLKVASTSLKKEDPTFEIETAISAEEARIPTMLLYLTMKYQRG